MQLIKPSVQLIRTWGSETDIAEMPNILYRHGNKMALERRINLLLKYGHHNVLEFLGAQWLIECSRACTHELVRHRLASYWQESTRFVDYSRPGNLRFIIPPSLINKLTPILEGLIKTYSELLNSTDIDYARLILPNALAQRIWVSMNMREFLINFLPLRTGLGAYSELRLIAWLMFNSILDKFPITAKWTWDNLPRLHPDYNIGYAKRMVNPNYIEELRKKYGSSDPRYISVYSAFEEWGIQIPNELRRLMSE
ncbi:FAD-dependent thymidylate synthase [Caldivirga maquilingensis]|uniref:Thymidylate synthase, flavin-dependent n=1 Tax=Caldivirga maquilingensis (strain ATCC 700844 / DSM 13496 / JCM 10307 / IC-167) TaxID=397948 RepID=A8M9X7_CALMQ|nr:FAD-dependent thymidylate synthase [Caldivirga maquilingensis]ABW02448.1 thymidylate synthase, flavin-dependent [Caldivirga maquilingensis IC-167]